jgi:hypothetical protein
MYKPFKISSLEIIFDGLSYQHEHQLIEGDFSFNKLIEEVELKFDAKYRDMYMFGNIANLSFIKDISMNGITYVIVNCRFAP